MLYSESLAILFVMLTTATVIGQRIAGLLPWRLRAENRLLLSPLIGLAVLLHLIILLGWIGHGYRQPACLLIIGVPVLASLWGRRDLTALIKNILLIVSFSVIATAGVLYSVWRYAALNPYNDTFTYLVHGQWLQTHGFAERAIQSGNYPATTQVLIYQAAGLRMGASFMLGYVQALMGATWSYQVYAAMVALPIVLCALAVVATAYAVCRRIGLSLLCGASIGLTLNGFTFGASNGFLPQTWGLAFLTGSLVLTGSMVRQLAAHSRTRNNFVHWIPVALLFSAAIHCYSEILPFLVATVGLVFLMAAVPLRKRLGPLLFAGIWLGLLCGLLVNLEWFRIARAIHSQASALVGGPVDWPWWDFAWHAMGLRTGYWDGNVFLLGRFVTPFACLLGIGLVIAGCRRASRGQGNIWRLMPHVAFLTLTVIAFVYFRFAAASPWPTGTGQSWNQFKLSNWATPSVFCLFAVGMAAVGRKNLITSVIMSVVLLGIIAVGFGHHVKLADRRTFHVRQDTGLSYDPLAAFAMIHQFSAYIPKDVPIFLNMGDSLVKPRQITMYALEDHALAGDWRSDGYLSALREDQRNPTTEPCRWIVSMDESPPPAAQQAGNLWLGPCPGTLFILQSVSGGYDREQDQTGWWHWTDRKLRFTYRIEGERPPRMVISFTYTATSDHQVVHLSVDGKTSDLSLNIGWHEWTSEPIKIDHSGSTVEVVFDGDSPPVKLSERDPRMASYLIKNLVLRRVD